jgi:hypothetical protein
MYPNLDGLRTLSTDFLCYFAYITCPDFIYCIYMSCSMENVAECHEIHATISLYDERYVKFTDYIRQVG